MCPFQRTPWVISILYDTSGSAFAENHYANYPKKLEVPSLPPEEAQFKYDPLTLSQGVLLRGEGTGTIVLVSDLRGLDRKIRHYMQISALVLLLSISATTVV